MWINFLSLLPSTLVTVLLITIAFLRFYDQTDFQILGFISEPRIWSNRLTVAAVVATMVNFGVEWYRRNRETNRLAQEKQRRNEEEKRRMEEEARRVAQDSSFAYFSKLKFHKLSKMQSGNKIERFEPKTINTK